MKRRTPIIATRLAATCLAMLLCVGEVLAQDTPATSYELALADAWTSLHAGRWDKAAAGYTRAAELQPASEDAWLGLQLAHMSAKRWTEAAEAGQRALDLNPKSYWARSRQAYVLYMRGELRSARELYAQVLEDDPENAEMALGLGFTLVQMGDIDAGHDACRGAAESLGEDVRVAACLQMSGPRAIHGWAEAGATFLTYNSSSTVTDLQALTVRGGVTWPWGVGLWGGVTMSRATMLLTTDTYEQATPVLGVWLSRNGWMAGLGVGWVFASDDTVDGTAVLTGKVGYRTASLGGGLAVAASIYPDVTSVQMDPWFEWRPLRWLEITAGPSLTVVTDSLYGDGDAELLVSGRLGLVFRPLDVLALSVSGYYGQEQYRVEADGLSVWSAADQYVVGYRAGLSWTPVRGLAVYGEFRHDFGDEQSGESTVFETIGGTVGVRTTF